MPFAVDTLVCRITIRHVGTHEVTVVKELIARSYVELVGDIVRKGDLSIEYRVQDGITLFKIVILTVEEFVLSTLLKRTHWILVERTIFIILSCIVGISQLTPSVNRIGLVAVATILEVDVSSNFKPIGNLAVYLGITAEYPIIVASHNTFISEVSERKVVINPISGS